MEWLPGLSLVIHISFLASPIQTSEGSLPPLRTEVVTKHRLSTEEKLRMFSSKYQEDGMPRKKTPV